MDLDAIAARERTSTTSGVYSNESSNESVGLQIHFIAVQQRFSKIVHSELPGSMRFMSVRESQDALQPIRHIGVTVLGWMVILTWHLALSRKVTSIQKS